MKYFTKSYEDQREKRSQIDNHSLGKVYKNVIEEYKHCMEINEYVVSFLLIQNLLEDRLYVLYKLVDESLISGFNLSLETYHEKYDLKTIIYKLHEKGLIDENLKKNLILSVKLRNRHIHFGFMDLESYDKELSVGFYKLFREMDSIVRKYKRELKKK